MTATKLTPEVISLVHHVELNESGWMDKAIQQLILTALCKVDVAVDMDGLANLLTSATSKEIGRERIRRQVERLLKSFDLTSPKEGLFKLSEVNRRKYKDAIEATEDLEKKTIEVFNGLFEDLPQEIDRAQLWSNFTLRYLNPLLAELGANTYELIAGDNESLELPRFDVFLSSYPPQYHGKIKDGAELFFSSEDHNVRSFILRSLNAYFFIEATSLREETLVSLTRNPGEQIEFSIFADTNFLLTLLGLKDSLDEAAESINNFVAKLSGRVKIRFFVLPVTLKEAQNVLARKRDRLGNLKFSARQLEVLDLGGLDEIDLKFLEHHRQTGITADDYFSPFIDDLIICLRDKGIIFDNTDLDKYPTRQDVVDDLLFIQEEEKERKVLYPKAYEQIEHDMILWHYVNDRRAAHIQSPLEAINWILTFDSRLRAFDSYKKRTKAIAVRLCLHPATFIQMMQFWIPRTPEFEEAILTSLRIPLLTQDFDSKSEQVTLDILNALNRFQNVGSIKGETINELLMSRALRDKISAKRDPDDKFKIVKDALIEKQVFTEQELERVRKEKERIESSAAETKTKLEADLTNQIHITNSTDNKLREAQEKIEALETEKRVDQEQRKFLRRWVWLPLFLNPSIALTIGFLLPSEIPFGRWTWITGVISLLLVVQIWAVHSYGQDIESVKNGSAFRLLDKSKAALSVIIFIIWSLFQPFLSDVIKDWVKGKQTTVAPTSTNAANSENR